MPPHHEEDHHEQENNLKLSALKVCVLLATSWSGLAMAASDITPSSFERATRDLTTYCMDAICLGMTIKEVSAQGKMQWNTSLLPDGKLSCQGTMGNSAAAAVLSKGKLFLLTFDLVATSGLPEERYRVNGISLLKPIATEASAHILVDSFKSRLGPMKEVAAKGLWTTNAGAHAITVGKATSDGQLPDRLILFATYRPFYAWIMSLPECKAKPTLP